MESSSRMTVTQKEQLMVMNDVRMMYETYAGVPPKTQRLMMELQRDNHMEYLLRGLQQLGPSFCVLDANRPWLCYWILHSVALLGKSADAAFEDRTIDFLSRCQDPDGGYAGGPGQMPHLATTYAAVNALITLGSDKSLLSIDRGKMYTFLKRMKDPGGAFRMHDEGEIDVRACYTAISVASLLNILDDDLVRNVGNYILRCQTYEGGIAGEPGSEAHGGYTFCGLATMILINEVNCLDLAALIDWVAFRQGVEGGFQGRTNKLVDGCYSFWQGGVFALLQRFHSTIGERLTQSGPGEAEYHIDSPKATPESDISEGEEISDGTSSESDDACNFPREGSQNDFYPLYFDNVGFVSSEGHAERAPLFNSIALQRYVLLCSQDPEGGLKDKPRKSKDYYHTCYCLSGLSVCQHSWLKDEDASPLPRAVLGPYSNLLEPTHSIFNVVLDRYRQAHEFFSRA
ncbi:protein farnesyltransferase subunit beta-like [Mangifera indica]|uniref:protein farnesyltransferase subunit beta-like n=1 Tax=Mangifera indica TaxID=29780 RepID=UPI001CFAC7AB|nr:protein farnesyltransferase subunit beta-like [Mangifera indica]